MSPWNMKNAVRKVEATGNHQILLIDRGTFFGYNMLVNDFRNFPIMLKTDYSVCLDGHTVAFVACCMVLGKDSEAVLGHLDKQTIAEVVA